jgi:hypothetical protein
VNERATASHCARATPVSFSEDRQIGGGCVGGLMWPCKVQSEKDGSGPSAMCERTIAAGNIVAKKLKHLSAHAMEPLQSSGGGQHGMSA